MSEYPNEYNGEVQNVFSLSGKDGNWLYISKDGFGKVILSTPYYYGHILVSPDDAEKTGNLEDLVGSLMERTTLVLNCEGGFTVLFSPVPYSKTKRLDYFHNLDVEYDCSCEGFALFHKQMNQPVLVMGFTESHDVTGSVMLG